MAKSTNIKFLLCLPIIFYNLNTINSIENYLIESSQKDDGGNLLDGVIAP